MKYPSFVIICLHLVFKFKLTSTGHKEKELC